MARRRIITVQTIIYSPTKKLWSSHKTRVTVGEEYRIPRYPTKFDQNGNEIEIVGSWHGTIYRIFCKKLRTPLDYRF